MSDTDAVEEPDGKNQEPKSLAEEEEVVYRNPVSAEISRRESEIKSMLGSRLKVDMDELEVTIADYNSDFKIVFDHFSRYLLGKDNLNAINRDATRQWKRKSSGLLRNFLVSRMALRDHTYVMLKRYWEADENLPRQADTAFMEQYDAKVKQLLVKPQFAFLQDLRNYGVHKALYPFSLHTQFAGGYMRNDIRLDRAELLANYSKWSSSAKRYIESQGDEVDLLTPMEEWSTACKRFYEWLHGAVTVHHMEDFQAVETAWEEYREWRRETGTMPPDWFLNGGEPPGTVRPRSHKSREAKKKRKRKQRKRR
ncbi:hypothetical protein [Gordonia sp. (in: high G+C Gram-positive bacteria)]|uniref:hypothetical protein n=1 Tax=Gordonia sp. (in: high G+C Gram-positive bacteria) TaxID=84139 RepID=UPI00333F0BC9